MSKTISRMELIDNLHQFLIAFDTFDRYILTGFKGLDNMTNEELLEMWNYNQNEKYILEE